MISAIKPYARARMATLGFREWADGFNFDNVPKNLLDDSFHVELAGASGQTRGHDFQEIDVTFIVRFWKSPGRDPKAAIDRAIASGDAVIAEFVKPANRLTQPGLKNVRFDNLSVEPLNNSNDNGVIVKVQFSALVILST